MVKNVAPPGLPARPRCSASASVVTNCGSLASCAGRVDAAGSGDDDGEGDGGSVTCRSTSSDGSGCGDTSRVRAAWERRATGGAVAGGGVNRSNSTPIVAQANTAARMRAGDSAAAVNMGSLTRQHPPAVGTDARWPRGRSTTCGEAPAALVARGARSGPPISHVGRGSLPPRSLEWQTSPQRGWSDACSLWRWRRSVCRIVSACCRRSRRVLASSPSSSPHRNEARSAADGGPPPPRDAGTHRARTSNAQVIAIGVTFLYFGVSRLSMTCEVRRPRREETVQRGTVMPRLFCRASGATRRRQSHRTPSQWARWTWPACR